MSLKKFYSNISSLNIPNMMMVKPNNKTSLKFKCSEAYDYLIKRGWIDKPDDYVEIVEVVKEFTEYNHLEDF